MINELADERIAFMHQTTSGSKAAQKRGSERLLLLAGIGAVPFHDMQVGMVVEPLCHIGLRMAIQTRNDPCEMNCRCRSSQWAGLARLQTVIISSINPIPTSST